MTNAAQNETIYALATAPGRAGIAIIRVSGPAAKDSLSLLTNTDTSPSSGKDPISKDPIPKTPTGSAPLPNQLELCKIIRRGKNSVSRETSDGDSVLIDKGMTVFFKAPASYTGEDVVEYHIHGGPAVIQELLNTLSSQPGHRLAEPGEFTRRAFENGKMDLTEAEAVADLINAETQVQKAQALSQMEGSLARLYDRWREALTAALAHTEADIEFPDEDLPDGVMPQIRPVIEKMIGDLDAHLNDNRRGEILRNGVHVAVIGAPNAGKSSLVNALAQRDVAIVSELAGTTRDIIEAHLDLGGYPVILADTAGLRPDQISEKGQDSIESEGIRRALKRAEDADIRLLLFDGTQEPDQHSLDLIDENTIIAINKSDIGKAVKAPKNAIAISASTGDGLETLINALIDKAKTLIGQNEAPALTRQRHRKALEECRSSLTRALKAQLPELMAEDMRLSVRALGRITGRVDVEDLLDVIFRDFCIGK
ncbi:MAG: tRNA modification GTPase MnmE [Micavibrio sp.]|nr:MAG: tRNA modification GTPase MnmE [Micavibrio sp.]